MKTYSELVKFCKLMGVGLSVRLSLADCLKMVSCSDSVDFTYKLFAKEAVKKLNEGYTLSKVMKENKDIFLEELVYAVEKTEGYYGVEFAKTFDKFSEYLMGLSSLKYTKKVEIA